MNFVTSLLPPRWTPLCTLSMAACLGVASLLAQDAPAQAGVTPTLHVYTNLVQIPVLVLTPEREKLSSPIAQNRFSISFDGGPWNACEMTGGLMLNLLGTGMARTMQRFTQTLRERYILEFPRPPNMRAGRLVMAVRIDKFNAFIRVSGDGVPLADPTTVDASSTIPPVQSLPPQVAVLPTDSTPAVEDRPQPLAAIVQPPPAAVALAPATTPPVAEQASPSSVIPTIRVATRLTVEDVTVTNAERRPVHGLLRSDFTIREDGKPQPIRDAEEYGVERTPSQTAPARLPANVYSNAQWRSASPGIVNILLLDDVTTGLMNQLKMAPQNVAYAKQQAMTYLKRMPPGTQVAILQLGNILRVVQSVTTDQTILLAAMKTVSYKPAPRAFASSPGAACDAANTQSQLVVDAMQQVAAYLSGFKGRKNLIWFTPGIPWLTDYAAFASVKCLDDYTSQLQRAYGLLNEAQVVLYPIDPRGLVADPTFDASSTPRTLSGQAAAAREAAFGSSNVAEQASLRDMADATGGVPYLNRNDLDGALEEAIAAGADYYSLSYVPPLTKYDGQYHTIDVKVDRPNLHLKYRPGYTSVDLTKPAAASDRRSRQRRAAATGLA
jgi:VWFA-related protein